MLDSNVKNYLFQISNYNFAIFGINICSFAIFYIIVFVIIKQNMFLVILLFWKEKKNYVTSMRKMLLRVFSTLFNGMKNEVYYYHMLTFSHNKFFLPSFNVALNSSRGKSWKNLCLSGKYFDGCHKNRKLVDLCYRTSNICNIETKSLI